MCTFREWFCVCISLFVVWTRKSYPTLTGGRKLLKANWDLDSGLRFGISRGLQCIEVPLANMSTHPS